jgi:hypothetical protein
MTGSYAAAGSYCCSRFPGCEEDIYPLRLDNASASCLEGQHSLVGILPSSSNGGLLSRPLVAVLVSQLEFNTVSALGFVLV